MPPTSQISPSDVQSEHKDDPSLDYLACEGRREQRSHSTSHKPKEIIVDGPNDSTTCHELVSSTRKGEEMRYPPSATRARERKSPHRDTVGDPTQKRPKERSIIPSSGPLGPSGDVIKSSVGVQHRNKDMASGPIVGSEKNSIPSHHLDPSSKEAPGSPDGFVIVPSNSTGATTFPENTKTPRVSYSQAVAVTQNTPSSRRSPETQVQTDSGVIAQIPGSYPRNVSEIFAQQGSQTTEGHDLRRTASRDSNDNKHSSGRMGRSITNVVRSYLSIGSGSTASKDRDMKEEIARLQDELHDRDEDYKTLESQHRRLRRKFADVKGDNTRLESDLQSMQHQLQQSEQALRDSKSLAETRRKELVGAQVFLTKADSLSISEIIDKVEVINQEIFQIAASLSELLIPQEYIFGDDAEFNLALKVASSFLGEEFVQILINMAHIPNPEVNPLLVQAAISVLLVQCSVHYLSLWHSDHNISAFLKYTYSQIRSTEEQAVSGRWRSITRAQEKTSSEVWKQDLLRNMRSILKLSFWFLPSEKLAGFEQKLVPFFRGIDDLKICLGEKFTSSDLKAYAINPGTEYNYQCMEDAFGDVRHNRGHQQDTVSGTAGIGVLKKIYSRGADDRFEKKSPENVLPPKVILLSTLREATEPSPPRHKKRRD